MLAPKNPKTGSEYTAEHSRVKGLDRVVFIPVLEFETLHPDLGVSAVPGVSSSKSSWRRTMPESNTLSVPVW